MDGCGKSPDAARREDAALVRVFQGGDESAFDTLVLKHKDRVFGLCYRILGDREEANDSAQEAFVRAYRAMRGFRGDSAFSTWLYRIAWNACANKVGSAGYLRRRRMVRLDQAPVDCESGRPLEASDRAPSPAEALDRKERAQRVREAIDALPPDQRAAVVLRDMEGLPYEEIAEITGCDLGTVKSRLARARDRLREMLKGRL
jgi:RNA polymerase sigma-70 factor (ECF subfamily)